MSAAQQGVLRLMASVDDHLQGLQHYGYSREQREAMGMVQDLLEALRELTSAGAEAWGEDRPCVREALAAIGKATGSAA